MGTKPQPIALPAASQAAKSPARAKICPLAQSGPIGYVLRNQCLKE